MDYPINKTVEWCGGTLTKESNILARFDGPVVKNIKLFNNNNTADIVNFSEWQNAIPCWKTTYEFNKTPPAQMNTDWEDFWKNVKSGDVISFAGGTLNISGAVSSGSVGNGGASTVILTNTSTGTSTSTTNTSSTTNNSIIGASTLSGNNPHRTKFSVEYANRVDGVINRILQRGKNLSETQYINYLTNLSEGIKLLAKKPAYSSNAEVQNITSYIDYELTYIRTSLSTGEMFMEDFVRLLDSAMVESTSTGTTTSSTGTTVSVNPNLVGACKVDFDLFARNGLREGSGLSMSTPTYVMNEVLLAFVHDGEIYWKSAPGRSHGLRSIATGAEVAFLGCVDRVLTVDFISAGSPFSQGQILSTTPSIEGTPRTNTGATNTGTTTTTPPSGLSLEMQAKLKGACKIDFAFFSQRGLKHGGNITTASSTFILDSIYNSFVHNNDLYMKDMPGRLHGWRDTTTNEEKLFAMCVSGRLIEDGINDKLLYVTPETTR